MAVRKKRPVHNNYILIIFDSCRYDSFIRGRPKVMRQLGKVEKRWSYASWTAPSHFNLLMGLLLSYEPDLCFIGKQRETIVKEKFIDGPPDLIVEVISESNRTHDTVVKFQNYAQHGVAEYWLVDPRDNEISTWRQDGDEYRLLGRALPGGRVVTEVLSGLELDPGSVLNER